jgi:hypothetical protein
MTVKEEPRIDACKPTDNWTSITFEPDLARFGMERLEEDAVALMRKRVYDIAGVLGKTVKASHSRGGSAAQRGRRRAGTRQRGGQHTAQHRAAVWPGLL